jgi:hypothetical protein
MTPALRSHTPQPSAALRTGTQVEKIKSKRSDSHVNGAHGIVTSSLGTAGVAWSSDAGVPGGVGRLQGRCFCHGQQNTETGEGIESRRGARCSFRKQIA